MTLRRVESREGFERRRERLPRVRAVTASTRSLASYYFWIITNTKQEIESVWMTLEKIDQRIE